MEGADAARIGLSSLAEQYDFLAVATSSNGEGDPPFNFHPFSKLCTRPTTREINL